MAYKKTCAAYTQRFFSRIGAVKTMEEQTNPGSPRNGYKKWNGSALHCSMTQIYNILVHIQSTADQTDISFSAQETA